MEDIESIDLGTEDWPREFKTMTYFAFRLKQYLLQNISPWHHCMTFPSSHILALYISYSIRPSRVWEDWTKGEFCSMRGSLWWGSSLITLCIYWLLGGREENIWGCHKVSKLGPYTWLQWVGMAIEVGFMRWWHVAYDERVGSLLGEIIDYSKTEIDIEVTWSI